MLPCFRKSVNRKLWELQNLREVGSSSPRQVDEISVGFICRSLYFSSKWLPHFLCVNFYGGSLWFLEQKHRFSIL